MSEVTRPSGHVPRIQLVRGDITKQAVDAIVNAANSSSSAEAVWMAPSTGLPARSSCNTAGCSAAARPARPRSHQASG